MSDERVAIFIDGSNLYHGLRDQIGKTNLDFQKFGELLCKGRKLIRTYYYNAPLKQQYDREKYQSQQRFFERLKRTPYVSLKLGRLIYHQGAPVAEKGVDIKIAVDMLRYAYEDTYDVAILVSGDGDFEDAIEAVKDRGKHVELAYFTNAARQLIDACDVFIQLNKDVLKPVFTK